MIPINIIHHCYQQRQKNVENVRKYWARACGTGNYRVPPIPETPHSAVPLALTVWRMRRLARRARKVAAASVRFRRGDRLARCIDT